MKRLLIISYYWPPTAGSGVQRWLKFSKYLPEFGWKPVIYTPENPERLAYDDSLLKDIPECAEILRTRIVEPYAIYRRLTGAKRGQKEVNPVNSGVNKSPIQKLLLRIRGNFFIPDPRISWLRPSVKFLKKYLRQHPVDAIVSTGPPQSMHLIALSLKKAFPELPWLSDFRDPWTQIFYYKHLGLSPLSDKKHHRLEQKVLASSDAIIAVSPPVAEDFRKLSATPVFLITNGFDESDFISSPCAEPKDDGKFRLVHTGLFASDGNPLNLWSALSELCSEDEQFRSRLEIRLAGKTDREIIDAIKEAGLEDNLVDLGYLPHEQITLEQQAATLLMLPLRKEPEYSKVLPGKIFEYLASRRPIIGIGQEDGAASQILSQSGAGKMFSWDKKAELKEYILSEHSATENVDQYSRRRLTARLVDLLNDIIK